VPDFLRFAAAAGILETSFALIQSPLYRRWAVKAGIHPEYVDTTITCNCGEVIHTRSTQPQIRVEVCSKCHPFFTGKQKFLDTAGRVERFQRKYKRKPIAEG
jgi:large subunit ribosomal protein L31